MKLKIYFTLSILLISSLSFSQIRLESYLIGEENKSLSKSNSLNPTSNTITDIITVNDSMVWIGTSRGVSLSTDRGENWTNFYGNPQFGSDNVSSIGYSNGIFWAATARTVEQNEQSLPQGTGLKYTSDLGTTWTSFPQPLDLQTDTLVQYGINNIRALPVTVAIQNLAYDIAFTPGTIWIATFAGGLRKSTDLGQTWQRVVLPPDNLNSISPSDTLDFCLSPVAGNFCSVGNLNHRVFSVISSDDNTLYVGTANGINKSTDNGISWIKFNHQNQQEPISGNFITALGYSTIGNSLWASSWKAEAPEEFYGVSSSSDGGRTWATFLRDERPHNFGFVNSDVMVATDNGVFRSSDNGLTWLLPNSIVDKITYSNAKIIFHTDEFYSAASSVNYIWLGSNNGLPRLQETPGRMWEGTWKIFFASQPLSSNDQTYCYPNPFNPRNQGVPLNFKYSTGGIEEYVTIRIFDFSFNYVRTVVQNVPRNFNLESDPVDFWDGKDDNGNYVPNGVYFYRVEVGDNDAVYGKILVMQ